MYELGDTIVAVSSPASEQRVIVRISGPDTTNLVRRIFSTPISTEGGVISGTIAIDGELRIDARLYLFPALHSYTAEDVGEIHIHTNSSVTEALIGNLLSRSSASVRMAEPGEFTARAYLNGKIDLAQAEAVNEIITSSNKFQLAAAEKLLAGRLAQTTAEVRADIMDCLTLLEAGLDFSAEDIEFMTGSDAVARLTAIKDRLQHLLSDSITYESVIDLPAVGIAGAPNAGKSSLLNSLLGKERSIVSDRHKTTRDVLTGLLTLQHTNCVLFDCAGLDSHVYQVSSIEQRNILDELAQQAAIEALRNSSLVIFCVDVSKTDYSEDIAICELLYSSCVVRDAYCVKENAPEAVRDTRYAIRDTNLIAVATKCDLLPEEDLAKRLIRLNDVFNADFLATSAKSGAGTELLRERINRKLVELTCPKFGIPRVSGVALTARHRQRARETIENLKDSISELEAGNDEVTAMLLRAAYQSLATIEQQNIDEKILERIFSRFCIGK
jgi:tRNA modification GTPase